MVDVLRKREHGWLRFNEGKERWSMPDPEHEARAEAAWTARYALSELTQHQAYLLAETFETYHHLMTHPCGVEYAVGQVRAVRRALRGRKP
jgi:hypothetical protein